MSKTLDNDWKDWIKTNLGIGVPKTNIIEILKKNDYSDKTISDYFNARFYELDDYNVSKICSNKVELFTIDNFLSNEECLELINIGETKLYDSKTTNEITAYRTSSTCDLGLIDNELVNNINKKICDFMQIDNSFSEPIQMQKYLVGQEFKRHTDYFKVNFDYEDNAKIQGNRTWTFMIYLNNVEEGGETQFFNINRCFTPKMGQVIFWNNLNLDGTGNLDTLHAGLPIIKGKKYIITKWFREKSNL
jgi:prolyl 4-hydroxylase